MEELRQAASAKARELAGEMIVIPGGTFRMGDLNGGGGDYERPVHSVKIPAFKLGKYEVTFGQWDACVVDGGCGNYRPIPDAVGNREKQPVVNVSWDDAQTFIRWLNSKTGGNFRLPTEAEWEYAARAGSTSKYSWGNRVGRNQASCFDCRFALFGIHTNPVGSFPVNAWGLYDMHGNAWEWVQDCWNDNYVGAPSDGSAWASGNCDLRVTRSGSWKYGSKDMRSAFRVGLPRSLRDFGGLGFRLAQDR